MAALPEPTPGLVVNYSYLWLSEHRTGREEGRKDRPCAIVFATRNAEGATTVLVLPVTHSPPGRDELAMEIPPTTKRRLGLDHERSWIIYSEANRFIWPGMDLRPTRRGSPSSIAYGVLPADFFRKLRAAYLTAYQQRRTRLVPRTQ